MEDLDHWREDLITCPYCKYKDQDSWELEDSGEYTCGNCEEDFYVEREVDVYYTSSKLK